MKKTLREYLADLTASVNLDRILRIGRRATQKAQEDSRRMGIPNVYSINGQLYYELPSGELTTEDPLAGQQQEEDAETPPSDTEVDATTADTPVVKTSDKPVEQTDEAPEPPIDQASDNGAVIKPKPTATVSDPSAKSDDGDE